MRYLLDSNVLITANDTYYEIGRIRQFWDWILAEANRSVVNLPEEILSEISPANEDFRRWLEVNRPELSIAEARPRSLVESVLTQGYGYSLANLANADSIANTRDALLIAYALVDVNERCVVTLEAVQSSVGSLPMPRNRKIPLVCHRLGIRCIDTFDLIRELDFRIP